MLDFPVMLRVKVPVQPQCNKFVTGVKNKGTGDLKLNDSPAVDLKSNSLP